MYKLEKPIIHVAGLPRSGSTLMCQLLHHHPDVYSSGHTSPLVHSLDGLRRCATNNHSFLSQLDSDTEYARRQLTESYRGLANGWFAEADEPWVVDKNRGWLGALEMMELLSDENRIIVCVRELGQLFGSIESRHLSTVELDNLEGIAGMTPSGRMNYFFLGTGLAARPLSAIHSLLTEKSPHYNAKVIYVCYEHLVERPQAVMNQIFSWLGLSEQQIDMENLEVRPHEADSYYRLKFSHKTYGNIRPRGMHAIPQVIQNRLIHEYRWFYEKFYSQYLTPPEGRL